MTETRIEAMRDDGGRQRTTRGEATRARIVENAAGLVQARGVKETSLDDVLKASGTSKSQLYHYFADKDALIDAVIALQIDRVVGIHAAHLAGVDTIAGLMAWRDATLAITRSLDCRGGCPLGSLADELSEISEAARATLAEGFASWQAAIEAALYRIAARGELRRDLDPADAALAVLAAVQGGLLLTKTTRSIRPLEQAFAMAIDYVATRT